MLWRLKAFILFSLASSNKCTWVLPRSLHCPLAFPRSNSYSRELNKVARYPLWSLTWRLMILCVVFPLWQLTSVTLLTTSPTQYSLMPMTGRWWLTARSLQHLLDGVQNEDNAKFLEFNPSKCASLHLKRGRVSLTSFSIQGSQIRTCSSIDQFKHLGIPTGFRSYFDLGDKVAEMRQELLALDASLLAPWQKANASSTFLLSKISFFLKSGFVKKEQLGGFNGLLKSLAKGWLNLENNASPEILYISNKMGGLGLIPLTILDDIVVVSQELKLLHSRDQSVRTLARDSARAATTVRLRKVASWMEVASFLDGSLEGALGNRSNDIATLWSRGRINVSALKKSFQGQWNVNEENDLILSLDGSQLLPNLAEKAFLLSKISFFLKSGFVKKEQLGSFDSLLKSLAKGWLNLESNASPEILYLSCREEVA